MRAPLELLMEEVLLEPLMAADMALVPPCMVEVAALLLMIKEEALSWKPAAAALPMTLKPVLLMIQSEVLILPSTALPEVVEVLMSPARLKVSGEVADSVGRSTVVVDGPILTAASGSAVASVNERIKSRDFFIN